MEYRIIKTNRKTISLSIGDDLMPVVRAPLWASDAEIDRFVSSNLEWTEKAVQRKKAQLDKYDLTAEKTEELIRKAEKFIPAKVQFYSDIMKLYPSGVKITTAKKRFGSCSGKNSLCFSCYLMLYPEAAIDYVVVHELAHIKYHNHSKQFYDLIEHYMPDFREREKLLKK